MLNLGKPTGPPNNFDLVLVVNLLDLLVNFIQKSLLSVILRELVHLTSNIFIVKHLPLHLLV